MDAPVTPKPPHGPGHFSRHAIGYATIGASMIDVLTEKMTSQWPTDRKGWVILGLQTVGAGLATLIAYRTASSVNPQPQPRSPKPNEVLPQAQ